MKLKNFLIEIRNMKWFQSFTIQIRNYMWFFINGKINNEFNKRKEK